MRGSAFTANARQRFVDSIVLYRDAMANLNASYLIKEILMPRSLAMIYGEPGSGKTFFALDLALRVATGGTWHGHKIKACPVVYIASEAGRSIVNRIAAWRAHTNIADAPFGAITIGINLLDQNNVAECIEAIGNVKEEFGHVGFVVIDTYSRSMPGGDENSPEDMSAAIGSLDHMRAQMGGASVLVVHHSGKDGSRGARGHNSLYAAVDLEIKISDHKATITKSRDNLSGAVFPFKLDLVHLGVDDDGDVITSCVALADDSPEALATSKSREPLSDRQKLILNGLRDAIAASGTTAPSSPHIPSGAKVLALEDAVAVVAPLVPATFKRARNRPAAIKRTIVQLVARKLIGFYEDQIWVP